MTVSYVYFIRRGDTNEYKVGRSKDPARRLKQLQTGNALPLSLVSTFPTTEPVKLERQIHDLLKPHIPGRQQSKKGEWFSISEEWLRTIFFELKTRYNYHDGQ